MRPELAIDFYKVGHKDQYPEGTELVYSNFTARSAFHAPAPEGQRAEGVIFFGLQYWILDYLITEWEREFFQRDRENICTLYKKFIDSALNSDIEVDHLSDLHDLGYLPIEIRALPEGSFVPIGVPMFTIHNTDSRFFWLTNYLESVASADIWKLVTTATTAGGYYKRFKNAYHVSGGDDSLLPFQAHDFSFRGMSGRKDGAVSGMGHLLFFKGTDTASAILAAKNYYDAYGFVGGSVPATEHSVMSMGGHLEEVGTFRRLLEDVYPSGIVSIVSDTWDFWKVITETAHELHDTIMEREGKTVFRPDSGDPELILCGNPDAEPGSPAFKGAIECLWDEFGGTVTEHDYKVLDPHVGLIYGDSITPDRHFRILWNMLSKGWSPANVVFGVGSYTYQMVTRDSYGMAMKATFGRVNGVNRHLFKDPVTDSGTKKSLRGLIRVDGEIGNYEVTDGFSEWHEIDDDAMEVVYRNGTFRIYQQFEAISQRAMASVGA